MKKLLKDDTVAKRSKNDCLEVLVERSSEIKKVFRFTEDGIILKLKVLDPRVVSDVNPSPINIASLAAHFSSSLLNMN